MNTHHCTPEQMLLYSAHRLQLPRSPGITNQMDIQLLKLADGIEKHHQKNLWLTLADLCVIGDTVDLALPKGSREEIRKFLDQAFDDRYRLTFETFDLWKGQVGGVHPDCLVERQPLYSLTDNANNVILDADYRRRFLQTTEQQEHRDAA